MYSISRKSDSVVNKIHYSTFCAKCNYSLIVVFHEYFSQDGAREFGVTDQLSFLILLAFYSEYWYVTWKIAVYLAAVNIGTSNSKAKYFKL